MALHYELVRRRNEFTSLSFDDLVEKIIDLENDLADANSQIADLNEQVAELENEAAQ